VFDIPETPTPIIIMADNDDKGLNMSKIVIPYFDPDSKSITPRAFLAYVDLARKSAGKKTMPAVGDAAAYEVLKWTDEITCTNAMLLLRGTASKWIENILEAGGDELSNWDEFKKSFKLRFLKSLTLTEKLNLTDLRMSSTESCLDFYDRCKNNMYLFFDDEWEVLTLNSKHEGFPWGTPGVAGSGGTTVTAGHKTVSENYYKKCLQIKLKLAFASGLRESIKRQTLIQEADNLDSILAVAQRVEASQKEIKRDIALLNVNESDDEEGVDVGAVNFQRKKNYQGGANKNSGSGGQPQKAGGSPLKCFYCLKPGHFKRDCITRKNDRSKNIFKTNVNATPAKQNRQNGSVEADEEGFNVENCQADISEYLNCMSA
jgi:hypothetical protein